ncbi:hypothetical protein P879_01204 [Paragonimus westermani]|uniref:Solute carrier family 13 (Sodium-dependent dicarboxylate transporter), member 2/3/5 n=1 Tax=Paragonimus westermani TaxID=34504 RepID=A0A8T0DTA5_9TREM|nr:hypothetical protein P879_01204 [Paragonimus westermani]
MLGFMLPTWFLSMWMSNTATTAMMITIVEAVLISLNSIEQNVEQNTVTSRKTPSKHPGSKFMKNAHNPNEDVYSDENQMTLEPASILIVDASETTDEQPENNLKTNELSDSMAESIETVRKLNKALSLCVCYASTCGGIGTVTGTAPNSIFFGQVNSLFGSDTGLTFSTWMAFACPISIILLLLIWLWLTVRYFGLRGCFRKSTNEDQCKFIEKIITREADSLGTFNYAEGMCCVLFVLITALWTTRNVGELGWGKYFKNPSGQTFVTDTQPAILVALLALILPAVNPVQLYRRRSEYRGDATALANLQDQFLLPWHVAQRRCPWGVLIILGGGYALSDICQSSGLSALVGQTLGERVGGLSTTALIFVCCLISATITEFTSNAATVSILLPIIFSLGSSLGLHPFLLALPTTIGTSFAFSLPAATPPNSIVFGKGRISVKDMVQSGIPLNIVGCLITLAATITYAQPLFGLDTVPEWAVNGTLTSFLN